MSLVAALLVALPQTQPPSDDWLLRELWKISSGDRRPKFNGANKKRKQKAKEKPARLTKPKRRHSER